MLKVDNINLYYGAAQALRGVSIAAEPGKVTCVLGRNGVGKTSLLRAMVGQYPISSGAIVFDGNDITGLKPYERARRGIGFVPQGREIFPLLTVEENLKTGFGPLKRDDRTIPDDVFSLFPVLQTMLGRRGGDLSGGQQQQLAIGRALVMRPKLLLLDEPTEGIQPSIIKDIGRAISYLRNLGNIAIVLVEQYLDFACELGDNFAVMDRGAVKYTCHRENLDPAGDASLLLCEIVVFGRAAMGERMQRGEFVDRWRLRRGGRLVFAETVRLDGDIGAKLARSAVAKGGVAIATALIVPGDEAVVERIREAQGAFGGEVGVSSWNGFAMARFCAQDAARLRADMMAVLGRASSSP